ncbi:hypothetical protein HHK36_031854 [Tetracentron sinense]|uniref:poly(A)-specific ribonuclease n=1 Tax=Tetracentron sinense TaxID=13715 RepID=A0A835D035_TETSI|nr:hypothetical protein HHK36_031854 [Tetracentron sinense]
MTSSLIRQVWAANLEEEVQKIAHLLFFFPVIAMDTEFPGVIYRPSTGTAHQLDPFNHYQILKANVDALKVIQVGLTLSDARGNLADLGDGFSSIWEFNFGDFDVDRDLHAPESIQLLKQQGIDFNKNRENGICAVRFGQLLLKYRIVYNFSMVIWVTFHSAYDFAYLIKILTQRELPRDLPAFLSLVEFFFGMRVYDMKHIVRYCDGLYGGLDRIAKTLQVDRVSGKSHQAGSDSLLTLQTFMKLKDRYFNGRIGSVHKEVVFEEVLDDGSSFSLLPLLARLLSPVVQVTRTVAVPVQEEQQGATIAADIAAPTQTVVAPTVAAPVSLRRSSRDRRSAISSDYEVYLNEGRWESLRSRHPRESS